MAPATALPRMSVVVPTRNRADLLPRVVRAVLSQQVGGARDAHELLVVDDASTDETSMVLAAIAEADTRIRVHRLDQHRGPAAARNLGWRAARGGIVVFTDDDCVPEPGWLDALLAAHDVGADVVQGRTLPNEEDHRARSAFSRWIEVPSFSYMYQTCNISYRRALLAELDGFDETFGTSRGGAPNGEDADLGWRAAKAGAVCVFAGNAVVRHPIVNLSFRHALRSRLRSARMVYFVRRHPECRAYLPHGYFFLAQHPKALLALLGWVPCMVLRSPVTAAVGVVASLPYIHLRVRVYQVPGRRRSWPIVIPLTWVLDVADIAVLAAASVRWRCLLL